VLTIHRRECFGKIMVTTCGRSRGFVKRRHNCRCLSGTNLARKQRRKPSGAADSDDRLAELPDFAISCRLHGSHFRFRRVRRKRESGQASHHAQTRTRAS
jgi:hypothetical protein